MGAVQDMRRGRVVVLGALGVLLALGSLFGSVAWASHQFSDVGDDHLFHDEISWAADFGITTGFVDGTFRPTDRVTRQATVVFLHRLWVALGQDPGDAPDPGFSDVDTSNLAYPAIAWAAELEITTGFADGTFRPTDRVTRQATVILLHRLWVALGQDPGDAPDPGFSDVDPSNLAYPAIAWAAELGITTGFADGTFRPTDAVTRQATVAFLHRLFAQLAFGVNTAADTVDVNPGDGICADVNAECSLRAAIIEANARPGHDVIEISPGLTPIELQLAGTDENAGATGDLDITDDLVIVGNGATVDAARLDRVLHIHDGDVAIRGLSITGGEYFSGSGGGIYNDGAVVVLTEVTIEQNYSWDYGGGIYSTGGSLHLEDVIVSNNGTTGGGGGLTVTGSGEATLENVEIDGNTATLWHQNYGPLGGSGGGVVVFAGSVVTVTDSIVSQNLSHDAGGGILNQGTLTISGSEISANVLANHAGTKELLGRGGGIFNRGSLAIVDSVVNDNSAREGGGLAQQVATSQLNAANTTVSHNIAGLDGGGLWASDGAVEVESSTISTNAASRAGGAIFGTNTAFDVTFVTIADNASLQGSALNAETGTLTLGASVIDNTGVASGGECAVPVASEGYNVASDTSCGLTETSDAQAVASLLTQLADNGGPTSTHLPYVDSPVVDRVPLGTPGLCDGSIAVDQRGQPRPQGASCDSGAVEGTTGTVAPPGGALTVTHGGDDTAADPTSGVCQDLSGPPGACSLRAAIDVANAHVHIDSIVIDPVVEVIALTREGADEEDNATGDLDIWRSVTIIGSGAALDANQLDRAVHSHKGTVIIEGLSITDGDASTGGAMRTEPVTLTHLVNSTVSGNTGAISGAGVHNTGALTVTNSTISTNAAATSGGGIHNTGALTVTNSTISTNAAATSGGGIHNTGALTVTNSTISANSASTSGGGIFTQGTTSSVSITASTIVRNMATSGRAGLQQVTGLFETPGPVTVAGSVLDNAGRSCSTTSFSSGGYNVVSDATCGFTGPGDVQGTSSELGQLADNGGPTLTHLPYGNSPVINAIPAGTPGLCDGTIADDQRGEPRPDGSGCDIGAVEGHDPDPAPPLEVTVNHGGDDPAADAASGICQDVSGPAGACSLRAAVDVTNASLAGTAIITIDPSVDVITVTRAGTDNNTNATGDVDIRRGVSITGSGATLDANQLDRALHLHAGVTTIDGLTITGGQTATFPGGGGMRIEVGASLVLANSTVNDNATTSSNLPGGGINNAGTLAVTDSTLSDNRTTVGSSSFGGGIYNTGTLTVTNSTLSGNISINTGGGIYNTGTTSSTTITASTIANNSATTAGAGLFRSQGSLTVAGSVLDNDGTDCSGTIETHGFNLASDSSCGFAGVGDLQDVAALLGPLADNGGLTFTHLLMPWSPAAALIPTGTAMLCDGTIATDQRGIARPQGEACSSGAVEVEAAETPPTLVVNHAGDDVAVDPTSGVCQDASAPPGSCSLRAAIDVANVMPGLMITIDAGVHPTLTRAGVGEDANDTGDLDIHQNVTVSGSGAIVDAAGLDRALNVHDGVVTLEGVTLTGGRLHDNGAQGAGIRLVGGHLTLTESTVSGNETTGGGTQGAGIHVSGGAQLTVVASTIAQNRHAPFQGSGGGIHVATGTVSLTNSTLSNNRAFTGAAINRAAGTISVINSTIATNSGSSLLTGGGTHLAATVIAPGGNNACVGTSRPTSGGYNIVFDSSCALTNTGDLQTTDALVGPLADNGGPTSTHLLTAGSPALDLIPAGTGNVCDGTNPVDQRGQARPLDTGCDSGAVERQPTDP